MLENQSRNMEIIKKAITIRFFEEGLLELYAEGGVSGTTHTYLGQELIASVVLNELSDNDYVISNHRCHGHFIAYSGKYKELLYEIVGDRRGVCGGQGGSQHISYKNFISNGVLGNLFPVAAGLSYQLKEKSLQSVSFIFSGDGALGQGVLYETLNLVASLNLPCIFIVENNGIAQTTNTKDTNFGNIEDRFKAFGIDAFSFDYLNILENLEAVQSLIDNSRINQSPCAIIFNNAQRLGPHSKGDDTRSVESISNMKKNDPLNKFILNNEKYSDIIHKVQSEIKSMFVEFRKR